MDQNRYASPDSLATLTILKIVLLAEVCIYATVHFFGIHQLDRALEFHETKFSFLIVSSLSIVPILIIITGLYGCYYGHKPTILIFSCLNSIHAIFCIAFYIFLSLCDVQPTRDFLLDLNKSMKYYDWGAINETDLYQPQYEDTWAWDETQQGLGCCGIKGPHDWDGYKPIEVFDTPYAYPKSCCDRPHIMNGISLCPWVTYEYGCKEKLELIGTKLSIYLIALIIFNLSLAFISFIYCLKEGELMEEKQNPAENVWSKFVKVQYNPTIPVHKQTRSKSCGAIRTDNIELRII